MCIRDSPTGSGAGITGATDKTLDIGLSSRALKDDEKNDVDGTTAVSYTHLDVYKRQELWTAYNQRLSVNTNIS